MKILVKISALAALCFLSSASVVSAADPSSAVLNKNPFSVVEPKEGEIFKPGDTLNLKFGLGPSLKGKYIFYQVQSSASSPGSRQFFCEAGRGKDAHPISDGQTLYAATCNIPPDAQNTDAEVDVYIANSPPPWPGNVSHPYSGDAPEIDTVHCERRCLRCNDEDNTLHSLRFQIRKNSMDAAVDNSTSPLDLDKFFSSGAIIDVTALDPSRIPAQVNSPLYSRADVFRAPQLQTARDIIAPYATSFIAPELKVAKDISVANAQDFEAPELRDVSGKIDARHALNIHIPKLATAAGLIDARDAKIIDISELRFVADRINASSVEKFNAPQLYRAGRIDARNAKEFNIPQLRESGAIFASSATVFDAPLLSNVEDIEAESADTFYAPELENVSLNLSAKTATSIQVPKLKNIFGSLEAACATNFDVTNLQSAGWIWAEATNAFIAPNLKSAGNLMVFALKKLDVPNLRSTGVIMVGHYTAASYASRQRIGGTLLPEGQVVDESESDKNKGRKLKIIGKSEAGPDTGFNAPQLQTVKEDIRAESATTFNVPELQTTREIYGSPRTLLDAPKLESTENVRH